MISLLKIELEPAQLAAALAGHAAAREQIYRRVAGPVFRLISQLLPLPAAREDVFQDTLLAVFEHLPRFRGEAPFGAWVRRIAVNRCFMHLRSPWLRARVWLTEGERNGASDDESAVPRGSLELAIGAVPADNAVAHDLQTLLARLSPTARAIVWLHEVEGWSHEEIAQACGRSVSFSKSQLARAHRRLREFIGAPCSNALAGQIPRTP